VDLRIGTELVGYRIEALLGRGGTSVVYRAEHLRLKRKVALKLLAPELAADERFRERFLRESELAASLDHPHIVPIYDAGEAEGQLYIAMRYVAGGDLKGLLRREGRLEPARALGLLGQVAEALDAAHEAGLVHRDVKPGNVLLDSRAYCYLSDFGLTKQVSSHSRFTATGQIVGTIDYVAPEVIEGKELTAAADLYSLGCLLFECLVGRPPFHRDSEFAVLWAHVNESSPRVSQREPGLPEGLDAVVATALSKQPEKRYGSARELVEAARKAMPELRPEPALRSRRWLLLAAGAAVAAVATAVPLVLTSGGSHGPSTKPTLTPTTDSVQRIDATTNRLAATIPVSVGDSLLAAGGGSIWAANANRNKLFRIDPERNAVVQTIPTVHPTAVGFGAGALWVLDAKDGVVTEFDPSTGTPAATIPLPPGGTIPKGPSIRPGVFGVWVQWQPSGGNAVRIDPVWAAAIGGGAANAVTIGSARLVPGIVADLAPVGPILWAAVPTSFGADLVRIDLRKPGLAPTREFEIPPFSYLTLVADSHGAWVTDGEKRVYHFGVRTRRLDRTVVAGRGAVWSALGEGAVWVANQIDGTVSRIDEATGRVVATIPVGPNAAGVAVGSGAVWVDVHPR
jgi:YVTN family beta-propeller protein